MERGVSCNDDAAFMVVGEKNMILTPHHLDQMDIDPQRWWHLIDQILPIWSIDTDQRVAMFLGQCSHESRNFTVLKENLNYRATVLPKLWPNHFTQELANEVGRTSDHPANQEAIGNIAYGNRMGNTEDGDGYRYRGRGVIQLTGKNNYAAFAEVMGMTLDEVVEYLDDDEGCLQSAAWFWSSNNLNVHADNWDIRKATRRINGGYNGIEHRTALCNKFLWIMQAD